MSVSRDGRWRFDVPVLLLLAVFLSSAGALAQNPHNLSVRVLSPYGTGAETDVEWGPPGHHTPWRGDWAFDIWKDNFGAGKGNTCGTNVYVRARVHEVPSGRKAHELKAKVLQQGFACGSGVYSQGGYMQKIGLYARFDTTWYDLGWVLYAHIDNMVYSVGDEFNPLSARIGTAFHGVTTSKCWGSCHVHMEFNNTSGSSCYNVLPPIDGIGTYGTVGLLGGGLSGGHCFRGAPREQYGREYWVVDRRASLGQLKEIARQAYESRITVGFSYDDAGVGDLGSRKVVVWGDEHQPSTLLAWYQENYGGVSVEFRALPGQGNWRLGPFTTPEPPAHRGQPREQYAREYWVVNSQASLSQLLSVVEKAHPTRTTVGFSYDDAGIGDLDRRHVVVWGNEHSSETLTNWYNWYYSGATVAFRPNY